MEQPTQDVTGSAEKVDTAPATQQEADTQNAVANAMGVQIGQPQTPAAGDSGAENPEETPASEPEETPTPEQTPQEAQPAEQKPEEQTPEPMSGDAAEQEEETTVYTQEEVDAMLAKKEEDIERFRNLHNIQKGENIRLAIQNRNEHQMSPYGEIKDTSGQAVAFQTDSIYIDHFNANKDIYTDKDIADFKAFRQSGDVTILQKNENLLNLDAKLRYLAPANGNNPLVDLGTRLTMAHQLAFGSEISANRAKQAKAETEMENQKKARTAQQPAAGSATPATQTGRKYTPLQRQIAEGMGTKLPE